MHKMPLPFFLKYQFVLLNFPILLPFLSKGSGNTFQLRSFASGLFTNFLEKKVDVPLNTDGYIMFIFKMLIFI